MSAVLVGGPSKDVGRSKDLNYLLQGLTLEVLIDTPLPESAAHPPAVHLGIVMMTKRPSCLPTWLHYHHAVIGVRRFYVRVEDTPELELLLRSPPWDSLVEASFHAKTPTRDNTRLGARQASHMQASIHAGRNDGLTHLLHIDDDEVSARVYRPGLATRA